jgi:hypothetical protein
MHKRQQVRDRAAVVLSGLVTTGSNVFTSQIRKLSDAELPALKVYTREEELIEDTLVKGLTGVVTMNLIIECSVKENDDFDDTLDLILEEVQSAMRTERANATAGALPDLVPVFFYTSLEEVEYATGETDQGTQAIIYTVQYEQDL